MITEVVTNFQFVFLVLLTPKLTNNENAVFLISIFTGCELIARHFLKERSLKLQAAIVFAGLVAMACTVWVHNLWYLITVQVVAGVGKGMSNKEQSSIKLICFIIGPILCLLDSLYWINYLFLSLS